MLSLSCSLAMGEKNHNSKAVKSRHKDLYEIDEWKRGGKMTDFNGTSLGSYWCFILWRTGRSSGTRTTNNELFWLSRSNEGTRRCSTWSNKEHQGVATDIQSPLRAVENRRLMYTRSRRLSLCCVSKREKKKEKKKKKTLCLVFFFNSVSIRVINAFRTSFSGNIKRSFVSDAIRLDAGSQWCLSVFYPTCLCRSFVLVVVSSIASVEFVERFREHINSRSCWVAICQECQRVMSSSSILIRRWIPNWACLLLMARLRKALFKSGSLDTQPVCTVQPKEDLFRHSWMRRTRLSGYAHVEKRSICETICRLNGSEMKSGIAGVG